MNELFQESVYFGFFITLFGYWIGSEVSRRVKYTLFNPLLISIILIIVFLKATGISYETYENGARYINYFMTPATVCLAVPLYRHIQLLKENLWAILAGIFSGCVVCAVLIFFLSGLFELDGVIYLSLVSKSVTSAIALGITEELGGVETVTVMAVCISGTGGSILSTWLFRLFRIEDPVAQGVALGTASHAMGTSRALQMGEIQGAMGSLAIAVAGMMTVVIAPILTGLF